MPSPTPGKRDLPPQRGATAQREQQARERRRATLMVGTVVLAMLVIIVGGFLVNRARDTTTDVSAPAAGSGDYGVAIGEPSAPHTVVVYEDFLCPFCGELEQATSADLESLAEDGRVYVEYRPFNLLGTDYSVASAAAVKVVLDESGPEVAKRLHDLLFENQPEESGPFPDSDWLVEQAVAAGADEEEVRAGIEDGTGASWVEDATSAAEDAGVRSTPTVLLDGELFQDGRTVEELAANLIDSLR